ncbi:hypothetical protein TNCV_870771 [Trichonephila clavipes]|nr:hypothetical protein TNCV_870771 [Trichonephila clavipes]
MTSEMCLEDIAQPSALRLRNEALPVLITVNTNNRTWCYDPSKHSKVHCPFVHDNARPRTANIIKQFLVKKGVVQNEHSPFSPVLNPPDFFLFLGFKLALIGKRFGDISDIQQNGTMLLNSISKENFLQCFRDMCSRSQRCIMVEGDYFEGQ